MASAAAELRSRVEIGIAEAIPPEVVRPRRARPAPPITARKCRRPNLVAVPRWSTFFTDLTRRMADRGTVMARPPPGPPAALGRTRSDPAGLEMPPRPH